MRLVLAMSLALAAALPARANSEVTLGAMLEQMSGESHTLTWTFLGYQASACTFDDELRAVAITRSDWLVSSNGHCVYVTGGRPAGGSVNPADVGRTIEVTATVEKDDRGLLYLRHQSSRFVP